VEAATSYKSYEAASAYSSRGYEDACERSKENSGVEGAMRFFGGMPYTGRRLTAVTRAANEGEY